MSENKSDQRKTLLTLIAGVIVLTLGAGAIWKTAQPDPTPDSPPVADAKRPSTADRPDRPDQPARPDEQDPTARHEQPHPSVPVVSAPGTLSTEIAGPVQPVIIPGVPAPITIDDLPPDMRRGIETPPPFVRKAIVTPPPQATILPAETMDEDSETEELESQ